MATRAQVRTLLNIAYKMEEPEQGAIWWEPSENWITYDQMCDEGHDPDWLFDEVASLIAHHAGIPSELVLPN